MARIPIALIDALTLSNIDSSIMSKRMQVLFEEAEYAEIQAIARRHRMTVAEWVRQALRAARRKERPHDEQSKLGLLQKAMSFEFPSGDIEKMLSEIEQGYDTDAER
jgi:hypothetical protein